jgi:hypothetical protein
MGNWQKGEERKERGMRMNVTEIHLYICICKENNETH